jgi:hypothetical protein
MTEVESQEDIGRGLAESHHCQGFWGNVPVNIVHNGKKKKIKKKKIQ